MRRPDTAESDAWILVRRQQTHNLIEFPEVAIDSSSPSGSKEPITTQLAKFSTAFLSRRTRAMVEGTVMPGPKQNGEHRPRAQRPKLTVCMKMRPHACCIALQLDILTRFGGLRRSPCREVLHSKMMNLVLHCVQCETRGLHEALDGGAKGGN